MVSSNIKIEKGALELEDGQLNHKWSQTGYALVKSGIIQNIIDFKVSGAGQSWQFVYEAWAENQMQKTQKVERLKRGRFYIGVKPDEGSVLDTDYPLVYVNPIAKKRWLRGSSSSNVGLVFLGSPIIAKLCKLSWEGWGSEQVANYNWMRGDGAMVGVKEWASAKPNVGILDEKWYDTQQKKIDEIGESPIKKAGWEFYPVDLTPSLRFGLFNWWW